MDVWFVDCRHRFDEPASFSMFDQVPVQVWLLIALAAVAWHPASYVYRHITHSPSRRDAAQPAEDLSWRTAGLLARSLVILALTIIAGIFIFLPIAERLASSPRFFPALAMCLGAWSLFTVLQGFAKGRIQPFLRGIYHTYKRETQPRRFWASVAWNSCFGCLFIWVAYQTNRQATADLCYNEPAVYSPEESLSACHQLIGNADRDHLPGLIAARGVAFHRRGDHRRAVAEYTEAIRLNPRDSYSHFNRGLIYEHMGDVEQAIADYSRAVRLRPEDSAAHLQRGLIFLDMNRLDDAVADFTRAHELKPNDAWPLANRGISYAWKNDQAAAERDFQAVRAIDRANPVLLRGEALLSINAGDMETAVERLTAALNQEPDNVWALRSRAAAYWKLGQFEKSRVDYAKMLKLTKRTS